MTFVCIVCRELLTNHPHNDVVSVGGAAGGSRPKVTIDIVSTKCGHMYHLICLNDWFNKQKNPRQECPYCKSAVMSRDYQRIFPIGDEETDEIESRLQKAKEVQIESASLKNEIQQFASILEETGTQLQDKTLALDILQYEFNQKLDEATKHKDENKQLKEAVQMLQMQLTSLQETHGKEKLGWDRKVGEVTREMALLRAEIEEQKRKPRPDKSPGFRATSNSHDLLLAEIQSLKGHMFNMSLSSPPKHSMACQTDFPPVSPDSLLEFMSLKEMLDMCMKLLDKEKAPPADRVIFPSKPTIQSDPHPPQPVRSEIHRPIIPPGNIRTQFRQAIQEAATVSDSPKTEEASNVNQMKQETRQPVAAKRSLNPQRGRPLFIPEEGPSPIGAAGGFPSRFSFSIPGALNPGQYPRRHSQHSSEDDPNINTSARLPHFN